MRKGVLRLVSIDVEGCLLAKCIQRTELLTEDGHCAIG